MARHIQIEDLSEGVGDVLELTDAELALVAGSRPRPAEPTSSGGDGGTDS